ncbi:MAG: YihY/virulence factor BrkB family protein [Bryobacteraceae bacterium]
MTVRDLGSILRDSVARWSDHEAPHLGAALAFYTLLSLAPLLIFLVGLLSVGFGRDVVENRLVADSSLLVGSTGADAIRILLAGKTSGGPTAGILASLTLLFGASGVFGELRTALNKMWDVAPSRTGIRSLFTQQLFAFGLVVTAGFLLVLSMFATIGMAIVGKFFAAGIATPIWLLRVVNIFVSLAVVVFLFGLVFRFVPDRVLPWRDIIIGAGATGLMFEIGKIVLGLYFVWAGVGSAYGAAGSLVAIIIWVYYSAQIFLFGAEFTRVYSMRHSP